MTHDRVSINIEINLLFDYVVVAHFAVELATCAADTAIHYFKTCVSFRFSWLLHRIIFAKYSDAVFVTSEHMWLLKLTFLEYFSLPWFFSSTCKKYSECLTETDLSHLEKTNMHELWRLLLCAEFSRLVKFFRWRKNLKCLTPTWLGYFFDLTQIFSRDTSRADICGGKICCFELMLSRGECRGHNH